MENNVFDRSLFQHWLCLGTDKKGCLELATLVRLYLHGVLDDIDPANVSGSDSDGDERSVLAGDDGSTALTTAWYRRVW